MENYVHKVMYYETDKMGVTHHSNYIRWMEEARIDFFNQIGLSYRSLESAGLFSPVVSVECHFKYPTTFEDEVEIEVKADDFKGVKLILSYRMSRRGSGEIVFEGKSAHCFVDRTGKPVILKKVHPETAEKIKSVFDRQSRA